MNLKEELEKVIARLNTEKIEAEKAYFDKGTEEGFFWCLDASYLEIQRILSWDGRSCPDDSIISIIVESIVEEDSLMGYIGVDSKNYPTHVSLFNSFGENYFSGFVKGVDEFWDEIKDMLQ
jgi:hypothetical protein